MKVDFPLKDHAPLVFLKSVNPIAMLAPYMVF
jgi:hypothetical protein